MASSSKTNGHAPLPPEVVDQLLDLPGRDDAYRQRFHGNPASALAEIGYSPTDAAELPTLTPRPGEPLYCMTTAELASKGQIRQARAELKRYLTKRANHIVVFSLDASGMKSILGCASDQPTDLGICEANGA